MDTTHAPPREAPLVIAHRGASAYAPENTDAAFELALAQSADAIELDVRLSADRAFVVWHDATLRRTARVEGVVRIGRVDAASWDDLRRCEIGSWFNDRFPAHRRDRFVGLQPLLLTEAIARFGSRVPLFIHMKDRLDAAGARVLAGFLPPAGALRHTVLSFDSATLLHLRHAGIEADLVQLVRRVLPRPGALRWEMWGAYADGVSPRRDFVAPEHVAAAHDARLTFIPHTVNDPHEMQALLEWGVDGIMSDVPDLLRAEVGRMVLKRAGSGAQGPAAHESRPLGLVGAEQLAPPAV